jgi:hypothetical protein
MAYNQGLPEGYKFGREENIFVRKIKVGTKGKISRILSQILEKNIGKISQMYNFWRCLTPWRCLLSL